MRSFSSFLLLIAFEMLNVSAANHSPETHDTAPPAEYPEKAILKNALVNLTPKSVEDRYLSKIPSLTKKLESDQDEKPMAAMVASILGQLYADEMEKLAGRIDDLRELSPFLIRLRCGIGGLIGKRPAVCQSKMDAFDEAFRGEFAEISKANQVFHQAVRDSKSDDPDVRKKAQEVLAQYETPGWIQKEIDRNGPAEELANAISQANSKGEHFLDVTTPEGKKHRVNFRPGAFGESLKVYRAAGFSLIGSRSPVIAHATLDYVQSLPPADKPPTSPATPPPASGEFDLERFRSTPEELRKVFLERCFSCHGPSGGPGNIHSRLFDEKGNLLVPFKKSLVLTAVTEGVDIVDPRTREKKRIVMPIGGADQKLSADQIEKVRVWASQ